MQNLLKLVEQLRNRTVTDQLLANIIREYLQVLILKSIYHSKYSASLSFMGGTSLRICHDLKRFSEDLDFALDRPAKNYTFAGLIKNICNDLQSEGYSVEQNTVEEKTVQKSFIKFSKILHPLGLSHRENHKIHIKLEVDTNPIKVNDSQIESFFVTKFDEIFPILKHKLETSFAGKALAILGRTYTKGRDYYDLIWYMSKNIELDIDYFNKGLEQQLNLPPVKNKADVMGLLGKAVTKTRPELILKDIGRFLEDPKEEIWLKDYQAIFKQLSS